MVEAQIFFKFQSEVRILLILAITFRSETGILMQKLFLSLVRLKNSSGGGADCFKFHSRKGIVVILAITFRNETGTLVQKLLLSPIRLKNSFGGGTDFFKFLSGKVKHKFHSSLVIICYFYLY